MTLEQTGVPMLRSTPGHEAMPTLHFGRQQVEVTFADEQLVAVRRRPPAPPLGDPAAAVREAVERPVGFPPLRRALTPDDHVTVVIDEKLPHLGRLLVPVLEHVTSTGVVPEAVTLLSAAPAADQSWLDDLPEEFEEVRVEVHDPKDRKNLAYVATTRAGRRLYLNRSAVDADQLVVLGRPDVEPLLRRGGAGMLYPALSDEATREEIATERLSAPALRQQSAEVAWLLGAPFLVQVVEGAGDEVVAVAAGPVDTAEEGLRLYEARWGLAVADLADTVVATVGGDPRRHEFADLARALTHAARVVQPEGRIILLTEAAPRLGPGAEQLRHAEDPARALELIGKGQAPDRAAAMQWAAAAGRAQLYLLSGLPEATAEELFVTPMEHAGQLQRLVRGAGSYLLLEDADKALPTVRPAEGPTDE
jgi:nickel-dependent lactate racemase